MRQRISAKWLMLCVAFAIASSGCAAKNNTLDLIQCRDMGWQDDCPAPRGALWFTEATWDKIGTVQTATLKKVVK